MSIDFKKVTVDDLKKFADTAKKGDGKESLAAIDRAKHASQDLAKDAKVLEDLAKKNPDV